MNQKYLNLTQIKQNKSENKSLMCKPLIAEEPVDATTVATSKKMNSEDDFEMSQHDIEQNFYQYENPSLLKLSSADNSSMSSDDFILTASVFDDEDQLPTQGPCAVEQVSLNFDIVKQSSPKKNQNKMVA